MKDAATPPAHFYPPKVQPAALPLRFPFNLAKLLANNLEAIPEQAYREPLVIAPGPPRMAFFTGSELVKTLLLDRAAEFPKGALQVNVLKPIFGEAMISSEGHEWRWQRGAAAPLFHHEELLNYGSIMSAAAEVIIARWRACPAGTIRRVDKDMRSAAFNVISNTMLAGGAPEMLDKIEEGHDGYYQGANWWLLYTILGLPHWLPRPGGNTMRAHERRLRKAVTDLVRERRGERSAKEDLLARLLRAADKETGRTMSEEHLVDNIVSFLIAGFDTTAFYLTWSLYLISQSPYWEERMLEEIEMVAGSAPVRSEHVERLIVVQQVLNESIRLFPTAPVIVRDIVTDIKLGGVFIPAGTIGIIPIYAIHRHHSYWVDPDRFDPDRFSPEHPKPSRYQFMPFGAGPRICIGAAFAMIEATIMLATFVRAARFELASDFLPRPSAQMFLLPKEGMPMSVTMRNSGDRRPNACEVASNRGKT